MLVVEVRVLVKMMDMILQVAMMKMMMMAIVKSNTFEMKMVFNVMLLGW